MIPQKNETLIKQKLERYSYSWGKNRENLPHYKYLARPLYKKMRENNIPPILAVPGTFWSMDLIFHQMLGNAIFYMIEKPKPPRFFYSRFSATFFVMLAAPVAVYKQFMEPSVKNIKGNP